MPFAARHRGRRKARTGSSGAPPPPRSRRRRWASAPPNGGGLRGSQTAPRGKRRPSTARNPRRAGCPTPPAPSRGG
eukprot:7095656-Alexandrium_andersonii.AAC.1